MLNLSVTANGPGSDQFIYQWRKMDSNTLPSSARGMNTHTLVILSVNSSDSGSYYCVVTNQWGNTAKSMKATVNVQCKLNAKQKHPGCKKCKANKKQPYLCVTKSLDIS